MTRRVVVTGYGVVCALGNNINEVYSHLFAGESGIRKIKFSSPGCNAIGSVGYANVTSENPFFADNGIERDKCIEMALLAAGEAFEMAGMANAEISAYKKGICVGTSQGGMLSGNKFHKKWLASGIGSADASLLKLYPLHSLSDVLGMKFGFKGTKATISTACAASCNAIGYGYDMIAYGKQDIMLVGGAEALVPFSFAGFRSLKALDANPCKPYSESNGINLGEGAAFFILEDYESATARKAQILAEVLGYGLSADAYHQTSPDIGGGGAVRAIKNAFLNSGLVVGDVDYINGHGTGTKANDKSESKAYLSLFANRAEEVPMSSIKSSVGHCLGAAGAVECAASIMAIQNDIVPPTINFYGVTNNKINYVPNKAIHKKCDVVLSNSLAFGGNNCCLAIGKPSDKYEKPSYSDDKVVITGIGCCGTGGESVEALFDTFDKQKICIVRDLEVSELGERYFHGEVPDVDFKNYMSTAMLRRIDEVAKYTICSGKQSLKDAGIKVDSNNNERIGVVYSTSTGPITTIEKHNKAILTEGFNAVNPNEFPNTVMNAAPGNLCISESLKGPTTTFSTGGNSALVAIDYGCNLIKSGQADVIVVVTADENSLALNLGNDKMGFVSKEGVAPLCKDSDGMILSAGSTSFVLESKSHACARGARIYAEVLATESFSDNCGLCDVDSNGTEYSDCIRSAISKSGIDNVDLFVAGASGVPVIDCCEINAIKRVFDGNVHISNPQAYIGNTCGSVGGYAILNALYSFANSKVLNYSNELKGEIDHRLFLNIGKGTNSYAEIESACIGAIALGGGYSSIVLKKYCGDKK